MALLYPTSTNALQKTLGAQLDQGVTASMTLNNTTNVQNKPGVCVIDRIDTDGNLKSTSVREFVKYTGTSGSTLTGLTRNVDNSSSDQDHAVGAVVEFIPDVTWAQAIMDTLDGTSTDAVLNTPALTTPKITTSINDSSGNEVIETPATADAVNHIKVTNAATGNNPSIAATGGDTDIDLTLAGKGTGKVKFGTANIKFPNADGTSGQALVTDGSGVLSFSTAGSTDGWTASSDTWTYASASTFTIAGVDRTSIYTKGTRLKFTQSTVKYAVVVSSSFGTDTTVTIAVNTDYTIANAAITSPYYSYNLNPQGYPDWFNYTLAANEITIGNATVVSRYAIKGKTISIKVRITFGTTTSITGNPNFDLPVAPTYTGFDEGLSYFEDVGVARYAGLGYINASNSKWYPTTSFANAAVSATSPFTFGNTDILATKIDYEF